MPIPPQDRHDRHAKHREVPETVLAEALRRHMPGAGTPRFRNLSGGFQNANYLAEAGGQKRVLRVYSEGAAIARRENALLRFLEKSQVRSPRALDLVEWDGHVVAVLEFLEGRLLQEVLTSPTDPALFREVGQEIARVHAIGFDRAGFVELPQSGWLGQIAIGTQYESFGEFLREFILKTMREIKPERLDFTTRDRLVKLVEAKWDLVMATEPVRQLVHSDFNPKNLMVSPEGRISIFDWEFCLSGNGLIDLGNFFRFSGDYPPGAEAALVQGYETVRGPMPAQWGDVARLLDLGNMCSFLERRENYPKSFHTARTVIAGTLEHFGI